MLVHPLEKEYEAGTNVEVHMGFRSGPSVCIIINDEIIVSNLYLKDGNTLYSIVSFTMPYEDITIYTRQNGCFERTIGDYNHQYDEGKLEFSI